ncbi:S8 family serine peptidase [Actinopolyspora mortivallis]|uniref:Peptidase S8 n=1 Tax=Actinopolyspora mortivallis TaxID=33906 RepID=A0A2T0GS73_ACTMO|nr:S8 family serine peptidase [Actinopolyspora mortivallis]PRW61947.1 peptidase S8 [Actinopolyspora mortivallis]
MDDSAPFPGEGAAGDSDENGESPTGRYVVVFSDEVFGREADEAETLRSLSGAIDIASTTDFEHGALDVEQTSGAEATMFTDLGIGVISADPERARGLRQAAEGDSRILSVEPERIMYALERSPTATGTSERVPDGAWSTVSAAPAEFEDTDEATWGLRATEVTRSLLTGAGISVAVLDTGLDRTHPDFRGRELHARSFVPGEQVQDGNGHGTHCTGTACGPQHPPDPPGSRRYGVAGESEILIGKVLGDEGSGSDTGILAGINWAVRNDCRIISMSLGANIRSVSWRYEMVGRRALARGSLIIAAAGNNANRDEGDPGFVGVPANSPSIMAVAAVDPRIAIADFSARSNPVMGGQVDIAAPGVDVYSTWPLERRYHTISGTSMATPHVSGIAALWAQRTGASGEALWAQLMRTAQRLEIPSVDVGAGLVKAPLL